MTVTIAEAYALIGLAHRRAAELGAAVAVAVVDEGGHLRALSRMDGAPPVSAEVAERKAASAALFRRDGAELRRMHEAWPAFFDRLDVVGGRRILAGAGSVLIERDGAVLGALAVSGGRSEQDDDCADVARNYRTDGSRGATAVGSDSADHRA